MEISVHTIKGTAIPYGSKLVACRALLLVLAGTWYLPTAQAQNLGYNINRLEPTTVGEPSFSVDHPWYSSTRYFAAGVTFHYAHNPLVVGRVSGGTFNQTTSIIEHQLQAHVELAGSFLDRITISGSLPITLLERGNAAGSLAPLDGAAVSDPRFGVMARLWGQPDRDPFSVNLGLQLFVPLGAFSDPTTGSARTSSDASVRLLPKLVFAGYGKHLRWSAMASFLYRPEATLAEEGTSTGSELQLGGLVQYADLSKRFGIGPEGTLSTVVVGGRAFAAGSTSLELLLGGHVNIARQLQLSVAAGIGALRQPGTPDARALLRVAYAPIRNQEVKVLPISDQDHDGIPDPQDACPQVPGVVSRDPERNGCPRDRDRDGVQDERDICPDTPAGAIPDPQRLGCPMQDEDHDGIADRYDLCPEVPQGPTPDSQRLGCPLSDRDGDGVHDRIDLCPETPQGLVPDPQRQGCPAGDRDLDDVLDPQDMCPDVPSGLHPDPKRRGCPDPDRDFDSVPDRVDACPDKPGAPHPDPKRNGCPSLVEIRSGKLVILQPVFFATNKETILTQSYPVLQAVADALRATPELKRLSIEGHTDNRGKVVYNTELSDRRARSVLRWLVEHGVEESRLKAQGYGPARPIADNRTPRGRATNRRVEFIITETSASVTQQFTPGPVESPLIIDSRQGRGPAAR